MILRSSAGQAFAYEDGPLSRVLGQHLLIPQLQLCLQTLCIWHVFDIRQGDPTGWRSCDEQSTFIGMKGKPITWPSPR